MVNSRRKGKNGELDAVKAIKEHWPFPDVRRSQQFCGTDGHADLANTPGVHTEVKYYKAIAAVGFLEQAERDVQDDSCPLVLMRKTRDPEWVVMFRLKDTSKFIDAINKAKQDLEEAA